jgi:hypothetical protein
MRVRVWLISAFTLSLPALTALTPGAAEQSTALRPKAAPVTPADPGAIDFFETKVRPLLAQHCFACHGEKNVKGGLRLDSAEAFFKGGETGALVVPGHPERSLLIDAVGYTRDHVKMPPQGKLKPAHIADLTTWVKMGAPWPGAVQGPESKVQGPRPKVQGPKSRVLGRAGSGPGTRDPGLRHWAFQPVRDPAVPTVKNRGWVLSPIDAFVLAKLEARGLRPAPKADRRTLIRRVTFDLTGLPPSPEEIDAFLGDSSPDAFAKVVDRLLASPAYGERWARHWLDVARYADSNGLDENTAFGNAWRYRDYVVNAFNSDKPYDRFIREQLAGDLLPPAGDDAAAAERLTATGFLVLGPKVLAEPDKQEMVMDIVDEQIDTMGKAFMGLTLGCARCHDHKFDPLPTRDYYALAGIFKSTRTMSTLSTVARALERPLADRDAVAKQEAHNRLVQAKQDELKDAADRIHAQAAGALVAKLDRYLLASLEARVEPARSAGSPDLNRAGTVLLEAEKFARGDVQVSTAGFGDGIGIIESAGRRAAFAEYEITLPSSAEYEIAIRYASGEPRPVRISLDGKSLNAEAAAQVTGGFNPPDQVWQTQAVFPGEAGKHLLRIEQAAGALPHLDKIALMPVSAAAPAPESAAGRRSVSPSELARERGLDPELLRRSAAYILASKQRGHRVFEPWHLLAALPEERFAEEAPKLIAEWRVTGKMMTWLPPVAALFAGAPPRSLAEVAGRYGALFSNVNSSWNSLVQRQKRQPSKLGDPDQEALRQVLYGKDSAFGFDRPDRFYTPEARASLDALKTALADLQKNAPQPVAMVLAVEEAKEIASVRVHIRGNHLTLGDEAPRTFLRVISGENQTPIGPDRSGRLELAEWLTRPDHPLTARVMVNRIWQHHFGEGIVRSPDNFGKLGDRPTHPELLDWLAARFVGVPSSGSGVPSRKSRAHESNSGPGTRDPGPGTRAWSIKAMHRLILLSNAYQMSATHDAKAALADPENRLLWRFNRRRLEVEAIRDSMLFVSGQLDRAMGGTLLKTPNFGYVTNDQSGNAAQYDSARRSLYLPVIRNAVYDVFQVFDFVEPSFLNGKRANTTVAPQALFLLNGQMVMEQARVLAGQLLEAPAPEDDTRIRTAYLKAYGRPARPAEVSAALRYVRRYAERLAAKESDPQKVRLAAWQSFCQILFASSEFVYVN